MCLARFRDAQEPVNILPQCLQVTLALELFWWTLSAGVIVQTSHLNLLSWLMSTWTMAISDNVAGSVVTVVL